MLGADYSGSASASAPPLASALGPARLSPRGLAPSPPLITRVSGENSLLTLITILLLLV